MTDPRPDRPTWLTEACPPWCAREHGEDDHPDDRFHQSRAWVLDAVGATGGEAPAAGLAPIEVVVRVGRHDAQPRAWVQVGAALDTRASLALDAAAAAELAAVLAEACALLR